ncbi:MAG: hypothetical protein U1E29_13670, partial [Coriobacteriia bacterium]|nr:hypothetical protein [Coriobacteriia bacterium]
TIICGMLWATWYEAASAVTPRAYAVAHVRTNPVTLDRAVDIDMIAVDLATVGREMAASS